MRTASKLLAGFMALALLASQSGCMRQEVRFLWTIRARFRCNGQRRLTQWTGISDSRERATLTPAPLLRGLLLRTPADPAAK